MINSLYPNGLVLHIRCRFTDYEYLVCDTCGEFHQLEHFGNRRTKPYRKIPKIKCGGSIGIRFNRKFITLNSLRKKVLKVNERITIFESNNNKLPF